VLFDGFTTEVAGIEFVRNALEGQSGVRYEIDSSKRSSTASARC